VFAEPPTRGSELGELARAIWTDQFQRLRDADRFFYRNDPALEQIRREYGIDYRRTLAQVLEANTDAAVDPDVFRVERGNPTTAPDARAPERLQSHGPCRKNPNKKHAKHRQNRTAGAQQCRPNRAVDPPRRGSNRR
jgi:hypothetical protein